MQERTPESITPEIEFFCKYISPSVPQFVPVKPAPNAMINECFNNVDRYIRDFGGKKISGRAIWQRANILLNAEAHAVWLSTNGEMIDVTPHIGGDKQILFLEDSSVNYQGNVIPSIYIPLTDSPLAKEFVELLGIKDRTLVEYGGKELNPVTDRQFIEDYNLLVGRINEINMILTANNV